MFIGNSAIAETPKRIGKSIIMQYDIIQRLQALVKQFKEKSQAY